MYVVETTDSFRYIWNNYKDNDRNHSHNEYCIQEQFLNILIAWYTMASVKVTDKTDGKNPKKREDYWRRTWKSTHYFDLMFKAVSGERHIE